VSSCNAPLNLKSVQCTSGLPFNAALAVAPWRGHRSEGHSTDGIQTRSEHAVEATTLLALNHLFTSTFGVRIDDLADQQDASTAVV
jgi:hypothetical protein